MIPTTSSASEIYKELWSKERWDSMETDFLMLEAQQNFRNLEHIFEHRKEERKNVL
jgi:hypothetical protein